MTPPPDAPEVGSSGESISSIMTSGVPLGMRLLGKIESEMKQTGLAKQSGFNLEVEIPVARHMAAGNALVDRIAVGDKRHLSTLSTRRLLVQVGIEETSSELWAGRERTDAGLGRTAFVLVSRPQSEDPEHEKVGLGTFVTALNESGSRTYMKDGLPGHALESFGVEIDLTTGKGQIIGLLPAELEFTTGSKFDVRDVGQSVVHGERDESTGEVRAVIDGRVKDSTLAFDFFALMASFARQHVGAETQHEETTPPDEQPLEIAS